MNRFIIPVVIAMFATVLVLRTEEPQIIAAPEQEESSEVDIEVIIEPAAPTVDPFEGYTKIENVKITHYCICEKCCGKSTDHPAYGITASGRYATPEYSVAVDRKVIPLGSEIIIDWGNGNIQHCRADDVGGGVRGNHIDLNVASHKNALERGVKTATIYVKEI